MNRLPSAAGGRSTRALNRRACLRGLAASSLAVLGVGSFSACAAPTLRYAPDITGPFPLPPAERGLQTIVAEPYFQVSDRGLQLEGAAFDRAGNLFFVDVFGGGIHRLTPQKTLSTVLAPNKLGSAGLAIHRDGRLFVAGLGNFVDTGSIFWLQPDGSGLTEVVPASAGYLPDDLVFDADGGFYFTDFRGSSTRPVGGVHYVAPDLKTITPILPHMAIANGVCLSPDGKVLWATELSAGRLHRVELADATTIAHFGTAVPYHFHGFAPDSMRSDSDGNVYVAMYSQGRVLVFNRNGMPIGQVLVPRRDAGHNLRTTSLGFVPGTDEMLILTNDADRGEGSWIFCARGFAAGTTLYSHR